MASRMYSTRLRHPSRSRTVAAILAWKPWQLMQSLTSTFLPRASGSSWMPCWMEISVQRTMPFCSAKSCAMFWSAVSLMPLLASALKPGARIASR